jgi:outer membrane receptor protein involved in Fe transport
MVFPLRQQPGPGPPPPPQWGNVAEAEADGIEVEWSQQILPSLMIGANATWLKSRETRGAIGSPLRDIPTVARSLINVSMLYSPLDTFLAGLHWYYVGDRDAAPADDRSYDTLDLTLTKSDLFAEGLDLRVGARNVFDELIVETQGSPRGALVQEYETRTYWARLSWSW